MSQQEETVATFKEHLAEFRETLIRILLVIGGAVFLSFLFHRSLFTLLLAPLRNNLNFPLVLLGPSDGFLLACKLSFITGIVLSSPLWTFFLLKFVLPGLKKKEKGVMVLSLLASTLFIGGGLALAYSFSLPLVIRFFYVFNAGIGENFWTLKETVECIIWILAAHAVAFEAVALLFVLIGTGSVSPEMLVKIRPWVVLGTCVMSALLTPPDVISMLLLTLPLLFLYECALLFARFLRRHRESALE